MVYKNKMDANAQQRAENVLSTLLHKSESFNKSNENSRNDIEKKYKKYSLCCLSLNIIVGLIFAAIGLTTLIHPLYDYALREALAFRDGFPSFEMWYRNEVIIRCKVHVFNFTNVEAFHNGIDKKLKVEEFGPIVFHEIESITDPIWNEENSTFSYHMKRDPIIEESWNTPGILNQTITVPNIPLLFMVAFLNDYNTFAKMGFNLMSKKDPIFINTTIYNYLFNFTTPALNTADTYFSFLLPSNNVGLLKHAHETVEEGDHMNVDIGVENGERRFFKMNSFNHRTTAPGYRLEHGDCDASIVNSTEGNMYGINVPKDQVIHYWRKAVCRTVPLYFDQEVEEKGYTAYKFITRKDMYDREDDLETDCFKGFGGKVYPDGLSDASNCYKGLPVAMSLPHFYGRDGYWHDKVEGYEPSEEKHTSFAIIEPTLGIPLHQRARTQSNLAVPKLNGFRRDIQMFSEMVVPLLWLEYSVENLTTPIYTMLTIVVKVLPIGQYFVTALLLLCGIYLVALGIRKFITNKRQHLQIRLINDGSDNFIDKMNGSNNVCIDFEFNTDFPSEKTAYSDDNN